MWKYLIVLFSSIALLGCSISKGKTTETAQQVQTYTNELAKNDTMKTAHYAGNPQVTDDATLQKIGDSFWDKKGKLVLEDIKKVNQKYKIGPIELTVIDIKVLRYLPAYSLIDFFHGFTHEAEDFDFVRVHMKIRNTENDDVYFAPIALIELSSGERMTWEDDFYLEELNGLYRGNEEKIGNMGFVIDKQSHNHGNVKTSEVKSVQLTTSEVFNRDREVISDRETIQIKFE